MHPLYRGSVPRSVISSKSATPSTPPWLSPPGSPLWTTVLHSVQVQIIVPRPLWLCTLTSPFSFAPFYSRSMVMCADEVPMSFGGKMNKSGRKFPGEEFARVCTNLRIPHIQVGFFSLPCVAPYCVRGGVRVVSGGRRLHVAGTFSRVPQPSHCRFARCGSRDEDRLPTTTCIQPDSFHHFDDAGSVQVH
jgi:hypothetical protein